MKTDRCTRKVVVRATCGAAVLAIVGCAAPPLADSTPTTDEHGEIVNAPQEIEKGTAASPGSRSPIFVNANIRVSDASLSSMLSFGTPMRIRTGRTLQVDLPIRNTRDDNLLIEYRFVFLNAQSEVVTTETPWTKGALLPHDHVSLRGVTRHAEATDFRLEVRRLRETSDAGASDAAHPVMD